MQKPNTPPPTTPMAARPAKSEPEVYKIADPEEFARNMLRALEEGGKVMASYLDRQPPSANPTPCLRKKSRQRLCPSAADAEGAGEP